MISALYKEWKTSTNTDKFFFVVMALFFLFVIFAIVTPVSASSVKSGWDYRLYLNNTLPNNSYVYQGANISQGNYYDISGLYGFHGKFAHWEIEDDEGFTMPSNIYTIDKPYNVYIDPKIFPVGRWYQWDGGYCNEDSSSCSVGSGHGNTFLFYVAPVCTDPNIFVDKNTTKTVNSSILISGGNDTIEVPISVQYTVAPTQIPVEATGDVQTIIIPTPIPSETTPSHIEVVTPKSDIPSLIPIFALIIGGFALWRRK